jgi:hypothetical protein
MAVNAGARFGRYNLEERLGQGGLAEVWRAVDLTNGRVVALKRFFRGLVGSDRERMRAEIELLAAHALHDHPNVVQVYGGGAEPEPHVVMEYLDRGDLGHELTRGPLSVERTVDIGIAVANALDAARRAGITHGDLKPSNILLDSDGSIKLADFNVARVAGYSGASGSSQLLVSFSYAAPEVWEGSVNGGSDLYALGCVLYECLTGSPPFVGSYAQVFRAHSEQAPDLERLPAQTPDALRALIAELLAKDAALRPPDAHTVLVRLDALRDDLRSPATGMVSSIGPWMIEEPHQTAPWAWMARHRQTGKLATIELYFGDEALGDRLRRALSVNDSLVPYGAERLLETNRLLLRPGENLGRALPAGWAFWVARDELRMPASSSGLTPTATANAADRLRRLVAAAATVRIDLDLSPDNLVILPDGGIHVRRPGLVQPRVAPEAAGLAALKESARPDLAPVLAGVGSLAAASGEARAAGTRTLRFPARGAAPTAAPPVPPQPRTGVTSAAALRTRHERSDRGGPIVALLLTLLGLLVLAALAVLMLGRPGGPGATLPVFVPPVAVASPSPSPSPLPAVVVTPEPTLRAAPLLTPVPIIVVTPPPTLTPTIPPTSPPTLPPTPAPTPAPTPRPTPAPTPAPTPPPQPAPAARSVSLRASDRTATNGQLVTITATADRNVAGSGYVIQIFNPDTGFVHKQCSTGSVCSIGGARQDVTVSYQARISRPDGSDVQARSNPVTVTWQAPPATPAPTPAPGWSVSIDASQRTAANGELVYITATANRSVTGTGYVIQIFNPDTGFVHRSCSTGSVCTQGGARQDTTVRYQARVSLIDGSNVQAESGTVTVTWQ